MPWMRRGLYRYRTSRSAASERATSGTFAPGGSGSPCSSAADGNPGRSVARERRAGLAERVSSTGSQPLPPSDAGSTTSTSRACALKAR